MRPAASRWRAFPISFLHLQLRSACLPLKIGEHFRLYRDFVRKLVSVFAQQLPRRRHGGVLAVAFLVGVTNAVPDMLVVALNYYYLEAFVIAVVIYMVIAYIVTQIADRLERALRVRT